MTKKPIIVTIGSAGLDTNADPAHLVQAQDGKRKMLSCLNVYIGDTGRINSCPGTATVWTVDGGWE